MRSMAQAKKTTKTTSSKKTPASKAKTSTPAGSEATVAREVLDRLQQIEDLLENLELARLTAEERQVANGRLRDGEAEVLETLLDTMDAFPGPFAVLADKDRGDDAATLETGPTRQALARRQALAPVAAALAQLTRRVEDDVLVQGERAREVTTPAYALLKANAAVDPKLRKKAAKVFDFYAKMGRPKKLPPPGEKYPRGTSWYPSPVPGTPAGTFDTPTGHLQHTHQVPSTDRRVLSTYPPGTFNRPTGYLRQTARCPRRAKQVLLTDRRGPSIARQG